ncbi:MAG TPA: D-alanyl-D-alanine carboxypeptidase [Candidatus Hungatella pullicola]|nr:D-alanyl-D-alanine carboxypeptidase [Candidatus Hungatella pullicola]
MKLWIFGLALACVLSMLSPFPAKCGESEQNQRELKLYAQSAVLMDGRTGRVLYGKNQDQVRPMASTTKIMTCILALELGELSDTVTATSYAASQPEVHMGVRAGEEYRLEDLLYALMLESYNDAAVMIAEHIGGSVENFLDMMNQKARDLGCENTCFLTPNGLDAQKEGEEGTVFHSTTATELGRIMNYCVSQSPVKDEFLKITGTGNYYFTSLDGKRQFSCVNHNALLQSMEGMISGKTGFTSGAGYSYVGTVEDGGRLFTIVLLGCGWPPHKTWKWSDAALLINYGRENYHYREIYREISLPDLVVKNGIPSKGELKGEAEAACEVGGDKSLRLLMRDDEQVTVRRFIDRELTAPVREGQLVGSVDYILNGETVGSFPVVLKEGVNKITVLWCLGQVLQQCFSHGWISALN